MRFYPRRFAVSKWHVRWLRIIDNEIIAHQVVGGSKRGLEVEEHIGVAR
jgi:hypothetical protein